MSHLWVFDLASQKPRRLTSGAFTVGSFNWSPDGTQIAFDHRDQPRQHQRRHRRHLRSSRVADAQVRKLVDAGRAPTRTRLVPGRHEDRVRVGDEEAVLVPQQRASP